MNASKNPKYRNKKKADILSRVMTINVEHMALLMHALYSVNNRIWYPKIIREFICNYQDTVKMFECDNDSERKDALIQKHLRGISYLSYERVWSIYHKLSERAQTEQDRQIYREHDFAKLYVENMLLMLMTLHYDYGYGPKRIGKIIDAWATDRLWDPLAWLDKVADAQLLDTAETRYEAYEYVEKLARDRKRGVQVSAKEEATARRKLEEMRAYQERNKP